ncbi:MAG: hypothetical protein AAF551_09365 [Bacteroidota bacterium]
MKESTYKTVKQPLGLSSETVPLKGGDDVLAIRDNRPSTVYQRQLRETMNAHRSAHLTLSHDVLEDKEQQQPSDKTFGEVAQRTGEEEAIAYVKSLKIRRGNRRKSMIETGGESTAYIEPLREITEKVKNAFKQSEEEASAPESNKFLVSAYLPELMKVGNCGEFGLVTYKHLVENTKDQWVYLVYVHRLSAHVFVVTSPKDIEGEDSEFEQEEEALAQARVVDTWYLYQNTSLSNYLDKGNHQNKKLDLSDLKIVDSMKAIGGGKPTVDEAGVETIRTFINEGIKKHQEHIEGSPAFFYEMALNYEEGKDDDIYLLDE